jgi:hypothetical protein
LERNAPERKVKVLEDCGSHEHCPFAAAEEEFLEEKTAILIILFKKLSGWCGC